MVGAGQSPRRRRPGGRESGQSLAEFAVIAPLLIILVFGIVDFSFALKAWMTVTNSSREGARVLVLNESCAQVTSQAQNVAKDLKPAVTVTINPPTCTGSTGDPMSVTVTYSYKYITPIGAFVKSIAGPVTMTSTSTMRHE